MSKDVFAVNEYGKKYICTVCANERAEMCGYYKVYWLINELEIISDNGKCKLCGGSFSTKKTKNAAKKITDNIRK